MDGSWLRVLTKPSPLEKGMANHFNILALRTPWAVWKAKRYDTEKWSPQVSRCPICYWRSVENSRKNEEMEPKQKQHPVMDVTGDGSKVRCCKEQYCIGTWNIRSMNQGKLEVVKEEMARVNTDIPVHFSSLIPRMSTFTLAISCLTTSNLPWFMDLTFQVPMQYCLLQHQTLLPSPVHPQMGSVFVLALSLHSIRSYFSTLPQ